MGASISFDSKYRLILDTEVECISVNPPGTVKDKKEKHDRANDSESGPNNDCSRRTRYDARV